MHSWPTAICHIDADSFFASVEILKNQNLRGKKVLVCNRPNERGIVLSASYEARPFGIRAGTPVFQAKKLCPDGILVQAHHEDYELCSLRLFSLLKQYFPTVEICSIDEGFLDLKGLRLLFKTDYEGIGRFIQKMVFEKLGLSVSLGIATTKTIAKIASDFQKPRGLTVLSNKSRDIFLEKIPIRDIPGVGGNTEGLLTKYGFHFASDMANGNRGLLESLLGKRGKELFQELNGESIYPVIIEERMPQSISRSRTFQDFSKDKNFCYQFSLKLLTELTFRLREYGLASNCLAYYLVTKEFEIRGQKILLPAWTDDDRDFLPCLKRLFGNTFLPGKSYRKAGIILSNLKGKEGTQISLFTEVRRDSSLMESLDSIRRRFGGKSIVRGEIFSLTKGEKRG